MPKKPAKWPPHADTPFAKNVWEYLDKHNITGDTLAELMGATGAMVSKWVNGHSVPDWKTLLMYAEVTGQNHWHLAEIAWGYPPVPPSDDLLKKEGVKDVAKLYDELREKSPELAADYIELGRTLQKQALRRRKSQNGDT